MSKRAEKTLDLYKKQLEDPLLKARINLDILFNPEWRKEYLNAINPHEKDTMMRLGNFTDKFSKNKEENILTITKFYEGIVSCVDTGICDEKTTRSLFERDIKEFVISFGSFFCKLRLELNDHTIASKLVTFYSSKENDSETTRKERDLQLCSNNNSKIVSKGGEVSRK